MGFKRKRKEVIHKVARPDHPGKYIYTAITNSGMSINEVATVIGDINGTQLMKVMRGDARLGPRMAFLLAELFNWKTARRWIMMQAELNMFEAGVDQRKARKILFGEDPGGDYDKWETMVQNKWAEEDDVEIDDHLEERHNQVVIPAENLGTTMQEEIEKNG